jgi:(p)ppGpp synthase/HD superfamily hydrolase
MIDKAIKEAATAHGEQKRKGTSMPYIMHPFSVGMILSQAGYTVDEVVAGILHDTLEDTALSAERIEDLFGTHVADIVQGCTESDRCLPWKERKQHTIEYLKTASPEVRAVACADKLHNAGDMLADYREVREDLWKRFKAGKADQAWYYNGLVESLCDRLDDHPEGSIFHRLKETVALLFGTK